MGKVEGGEPAEGKARRNELSPVHASAEATSSVVVGV